MELKDVGSKVAKGLSRAASGISRARDIYNYATGKSSHSLSGLKSASPDEIKSFKELDEFVDQFASVDAGIEIQVDSTGNNYLVTFSAAEVPSSIADQCKPGGSYYDMIHRYDKGSKQVEMIFTKDKKKESVMAPTPTPYKLELKTESGVGYDLVDRKSVKDSEGFTTDYSWYKSTNGMNVFVFGDSDFYGPADGEFDFETESDEEAQEWFDSYNGFDDDEDSIFESLIETAGLDTSVLVRKVNDDGEDSIEMDINGRVYSFTMKEDSPYSIDQMFHKVTKMRNYSEGRALQFMKKNMIGRRVESVLREGSTDLTDDIHRSIDAIYERKDKYKSQDDMIDAMYGAICDCLQGYQFLSRDKNEVIEDILQKNLDRLGIEVEEESFLHERLVKEEFTDKKTITLEVNDPDSQIEGLIRYIKETAGAGHSFTVRVDSEGSDSYKEFWIDGDGSDHIIDIKSESLEESGPSRKTKTVKQYEIEYTDSQGVQRYARYIAKSKADALRQFKEETPDAKRVDCTLRQTRQIEESPYFGQGLGDTWGRDNSDYHDLRDKDMRNHPDIGKRVRVINKSSEFYMKSFVVSRVENDTYFFDLGGTTISLKRDDLKFIKSESGNPFKDKHICDGCGKPLSQCTCEIEEEDINLDEMLTESVYDRPLSKGEWVVINAEHRLRDICHLVPVKVDHLGYRGRGFHGWAYGEGLREYDQSWVVYYAKSEDDAMDFIDSHKGLTVADLRKATKESLTSSATQSTNIGQHKVGTIQLDMFSDKEEG